jgi:WD40 repeat protein
MNLAARPEKGKQEAAHRRSILTLIVLAGSVCCAVPSLRAQEKGKLTTLRLDEPMASAAVSPNGHYIVVDTGRSVQKADGTWDSAESVQVLEPASSKVVAKIDLPGAALLKDAPLSSTDGFLSYCDDGQYLVVYDLIGTLYVLNANSYQIESSIALGNLRGHDSQGTVLGITVTCAARGNLIAVNAYGGRFGWGLVRLFDLRSGQQVAELRQDSSSGAEFSEISVSSSGSKLAILLKDPKWKKINVPNVEIRETRSLKLLTGFSTHDVPRGLIFAGESEIVTVQEQPSGWSPPKQVLRLWDVESGKEERRFSDARFDVEGPISSSADGRRIVGSVIKYHECKLCNGLEGRIDVKEQRFAVWDKATGAEVFRSDPFGPIIEPLGARCALSQNGGDVLVYWPDSQISPRLFPIR